ncbi:hypothetical protein ACLOJK_034286 [Asimina triloba]
MLPLLAEIFMLSLQYNLVTVGDNNHTDPSYHLGSNGLGSLETPRLRVMPSPPNQPPAPNVGGAIVVVHGYCSTLAASGAIVAGHGHGSHPPRRTHVTYKIFEENLTVPLL